MTANTPTSTIAITGMTSPLVLQSLSSSLSRRSAIIAFFLAVVWVSASATRNSPSISNHHHHCLHHGQTAFVSTPMTPSTRLLFRSGHAVLGAAHRALLSNTHRPTFFRPSLFGLAAGMSGLAAAASASTSSPSSASCSPTTSLPPCARVIPVPILSDNFAYLIIDPQTGKAACVDPAEPEKVLAAAKREGIQLSTLLCTHKHWDHAGGNEEMARLLPGLEVVTTKFEDIPAATVRLGDDDVYTLGSLSVRALYTPCHTKGHVLFLVTPQDESELQEGKTAPVLFSGDTLFVGGCGRFFEGDGQQMVEALMGRVAKLPPQTLVYCGHEYTQSNLAFALSVEPDNVALQAKAAWAATTLQQGGHTVPSTVGSELETNPFMRVGEKGVIKAARERGGATGEDPARVMTALREMKNSFKG